MPIKWGAGGGGARGAINDELTRGIMDKRRDKCLITSAAFSHERCTVISSMFYKMKRCVGAVPTA